MKKFLLSICLLLGLVISGWTTFLQSQFLTSIGVSPLGAIAIEPLLIITSFLIGFKISNWHKSISILFMVILTLVSMISILSMYLKTTYTEIAKIEQNKIRIEQVQQTEELIQNSLQSLTERKIGAKNTLKLIDKLQSQQQEVNVKGTESELSSIIKILSTFLMLSPEKATLLFSVLISLATVFSPSFLFFSAGLILLQIKEEKNHIIEEEEIEQKREKLTPKQRTTLSTIKETNGDIEETAKILNVPERTIKAQITRIEEKTGEEILPKQDKEVFIPQEHGVHGSYIPKI